MLYLAEVIKNSQGLLSFAQTKLILLACQHNSHNWTILSEPKEITLKTSCHFSQKTLVTINIVNEQKVIGKIELAKPWIIKILREFLNSQEKYQQQQKQIEDWKQSLKYQFEELERQKRNLELQQIEFQTTQSNCVNSSLQSNLKQNKSDKAENLTFCQKLIGEVLQEANLVSDAQLELALTTQTDYPELKVGEILALRGWIKLETVDFFAKQWLVLLNCQENYPLGFYLTQAGLLNEEQINIILNEQKELKLKLGEMAVVKGWLTKKTLNYFIDNLVGKESQVIAESN